MYLRISLLILWIAACWTVPATASDTASPYPYLPAWSGELPGSGPETELYTGAKGVQLGYHAYRVEDGKARIALVYLHGIESHAGWFHYASRMLNGEGFDVFALDRRGSGTNRENRGYRSGHVNHYQDLLQDVREFIREKIEGNYDRVYLIGLSWGGKQAVLYALNYPETVDGIILVTPGIKAHVDAGSGQKLGIFLARIFAPRKPFKTPIKTEMFTDVPLYQDYIRQDPLKLHSATARFFMESRKMDGYLEKHIGELTTPTLLILTRLDPIIDNEGVENALCQSPAPLSIYYYADQKHSVQLEDPARLTRDMARWIRRQSQEGAQ